MYIKQKRGRDREYVRKTKVKMTSSRHAGVYTDTTMEDKLIHDDDFTFSSPEYSTPQKFKSPYEGDSDEELWTLKMRG